MRKDFEKQIAAYNGDFEKAMDVVIKNAKRRDKYSFLFNLPIRAIKKIGRYLQGR